MKKLALILACTSLIGFNMAADDNPAEPKYKEGKANFDQYDDAQTKMYLQQPVDTIAVGTALLNGYELYLEALPLDTVLEVNKDGTPKIDKKTGLQKYKTKYSKDIISTIAGHHNDFLSVGYLFNLVQEYALAAKAWNIYTTMPSAEYLGNQKPVVPDSTLATFRYNEGLMWFQAKENEKALDAFYSALNSGYNYKECTDMIKYLVSTTYDKLSQEENYDECEQLLSTAMQNCPNEGIFDMIKGIMIEVRTEDIEQAVKYYKEATEKDPTLAQAYYHVGRYYITKANEVMNAEENLYLTDDDLEKLLSPICIEAKPYLEKAVALDPNNSDAQRLLDWVNDRLD